MKVDQHVTGIKKYTPSFEYTKQMAKERLGKAYNSVDSFETRSLKEKISHIKHILRNIKSSGLEYIEQMVILAEKGAVFSDALSSFGKLSLGESTLAPTVCMVGEMVANHSASTKASSMSLSSQVVSPMIKFYEEELEEIKALRHDQERVRIQYEAQTARLKDYQKRSSKKLTAVEVETILVKEQYDRITNDLNFKCDELIVKMEETLLPSMQAYISFQAAFFSNLTEQWKRMEKNMSSAMPRIDNGDGAGAGSGSGSGSVDKGEYSRARSQSSPPAPGFASM